MTDKPIHDQLKKNMFSGASTALIDFVIMALSYKFYLMILGYDEYGVWLIISTVLGFLQMGGNLGVESAVVKFVAEEYGRDDIKAIQSYVVTAISVLMLTGTIAALFILIFKFQIINLFNLTEGSFLIASKLLPYVGVLCVYAFVTRILSATLSGLGRMDLVNYTRVASRVVLFFIAIFFLRLGYGSVSLLIANLVSYFIIHIIIINILNRKYKIRILQIRSWDFIRLKKLLHFGIGFVGSSFLVMLLSPFNVMIISRYLGPGFVPIYEIAFRGAMQLRSVVEAGFRAIMPEISRLSGKMQKNELFQMKAISCQSLKLVFVFGAPLFLGCIFLVLNTPLLQWWLAERYVDELNVVLSIMFIGSFLSLIGVAAYYTIIGMGFVRHVVISHIIQSSLNVLMISLALFLDLSFSVTLIVIIISISMGLSTVYLILQERRLFSILFKKQQVEVDSIDLERVSENNKTTSNVLIDRNEGSRIKIAYCTSTDSNDKRAWSGLHYYVRKSLEKHCGDVITVGPFKNRYIILAKIINKLMFMLLKRHTTYGHSTIVSKEFSRQLFKRLKNIDVDILFFPGGSGMIAYLNIDKPIIYLTDSTFDSMVNYYETFSNLLPISKRMGNFIESNALNKASYVIFASDWAKDKALESYGCASSDMTVIPFGANIDKVPDRELILKLRKENFSGCTLLLVGVSWERKGCQTAFDAMCKLNERGIETELIVCGCQPPVGVSHDKLTITGFLDKNDPEALRKIQQIYMRANIFILPTRNECAGIVLCESGAYGLPTIASDTGGVSTYITNNDNGYLLPLESIAENYVDVIESIIADKDLYFDLAVKARDKFENELNWDSWGRKVSKLIESKF